ncbi:MEDS domain-containing protein [Streptomyces erythrochromogenes]|uniref:MEDS domain-containing protein n=1 Tax=Streptomyces erythrochromogenes TaxID=285574 RepID=UPI00386D6C78|nr:MEDS domain-containing protein [Streptomyces erythrochromogenes]
MAVEVDAHTLAVEQMRLGDHAFAQYADDATRWGVLGVFAQFGLARGEKVIVLADPAVPHDEVFQRLFPYAELYEAERESGQLAFTSMRELIRPQRRFTAERQMGRLREETEQAIVEGFAGLRSIIDMAWVQDLAMDIEGVMHRETHADALFEDRLYAEICTYDRRRFAPETVEAMRVGHPVALLEQPGQLGASHVDHGLRLVGEADWSTREQWSAAFQAALAGSGGEETLTIDLTPVTFLSVTCAAEVLRQVQRCRLRERVEAHCSPFHAQLLRRLGACEVEALVLVESEGAAR